METSNRYKYLILCDRMGDYHRARIREVVKIVGEENVWAGDLGGTDGTYNWESGTDVGNYFSLSQKAVEKVGAVEGLKAFSSVVKREKITHVCIPGYGRGAYLLILIWARLKGLKILMFAESWYPGSLLFDRLKGGFLKYFTTACFVSGERARIHFSKRLKYPSKRIHKGYSVVDNTHFALIKAEKSLPQQLLCVARFSEEKNLELLIRAFKLSKLSKSWELILVGGGPFKKELLTMSEGVAIKIVDWVKYQDLPDLYGKASCFILPSSFEPWGLVVNEAMAARLPVILSEEVGALPDLLDDGGNGWRFESKNEGELIKVMNELAELDRKTLTKMGGRSAYAVSQYTTKKWAEVIVGDWSGA
jgi:glycosyltransferase involved in cell wall biosynthesis